MDRKRRQSDVDGDNNKEDSPLRGVVVLAHGSRQGSDTYDGLQRIVRRLHARLGEDRAKVVLACLEFIQPDLVQAVTGLVDEGIIDITVMPFLLGKGTHVREDLIEETKRAMSERPNARIRTASSFGCDPAMAEIVVERVLAQAANLNGSGFAHGKTKGVVIVKAGTRSSEEDHSWLFELGGIVEHRLGDGYAVGVAQSHFAEPTMEGAVRELIENRGVSSITCVPYIFFPGLILARNIIGGVEQIKGRYPNIEFSIAQTIGVDDKLIEATAQKVLAVWEGFATMNQGEPPKHHELLVETKRKCVG